MLILWVLLSTASYAEIVESSYPEYTGYKRFAMYEDEKSTPMDPVYLYRFTACGI